MCFKFNTKQQKELLKSKLYKILNFYYVFLLSWNKKFDEKKSENFLKNAGKLSKLN